MYRDGAEALDYIFARGQYASRQNNGLPVLILLDLKMPKVNGIEVLEAIRATTRFATLPVVITSSSPALPHRINLDQLRIARYITKPVNLQDFLSIGTTLKEVLLEGKLKRAAGHG